MAAADKLFSRVWVCSIVSLVNGQIATSLGRQDIMTNRHIEGYTRQ